MRHWTLGLIALLLLSLKTQAIDFVQTNHFRVADDQTITQETWLSAPHLSVLGTVSSDLLAATQNADLAGTFKEDVWCAGETILASGIFQNGARLAGRSVQFQGTGRGPVIAVGNTVKIDRTAILEDGLVCAGENVILEGNVTGPVRILAQNATLGGQINGDAFLGAQNIVILPGTVINGDLTYSAPHDLVLPASVTLNGTLLKKLSVPPAPQLLKANLTTHVMFAIAALVTGLVFSGLFPRYSSSAVYALKNSTALSALIGFTSLVMIPLAAFMIIFTFIGLPLSILMLLFYCILLYLGKVVTAVWIGSIVLRRKEFSQRKAAAPLLMGLVILYALSAFTAAAFLVNLLATIFGLGALLIALFKKPVLVIQADELPSKNVT